MIWKRIILGYSTPSVLSFGDGLIRINPNVSWYTGLDPMGITNIETDLYSAVLHEALHMIGFTSLINNDGSPLQISTNMSSFYSLWDSYLTGTGTNSGNLVIPAITNIECCNDHIFNETEFSNLPDDLINDGCNGTPPNSEIWFGNNIAPISSNTGYVSIPGYLSHIDEVCASVDYYVMHAELMPGDTKRLLHSDEISILQTLGYILNSTGTSECYVEVTAEPQSHSIQVISGETIEVPLEELLYNDFFNQPQNNYTFEINPDCSGDFLNLVDIQLSNQNSLLITGLSLPTSSDVITSAICYSFSCPSGGFCNDGFFWITLIPDYPSGPGCDIGCKDISCDGKFDGLSIGTASYFQQIEMPHFNFLSESGQPNNASIYFSGDELIQDPPNQNRFLLLNTPDDGIYFQTTEPILPDDEVFITFNSASLLNNELIHIYGSNSPPCRLINPFGGACAANANEQCVLTSGFVPYCIESNIEIEGTIENSPTPLNFGDPAYPYNVNLKSMAFWYNEDITWHENTICWKNNTGIALDHIFLHATGGQSFVLVDDITIEKLPDLSFTHEILPNCQVQFTSDENECGAVIHDWDFGGAGVSTDANPIYAFPGTGEYEITHTYSIGNCAPIVETKNISLACGCDCPPNSLVVGESGLPTNLSDEVDANGVLPSHNIMVEGTFIIDAQNIPSNPGNYVFPPNSNTCMGPGASIEIPNGNTLSFEDGTHIRGCEMRWKGITVRAGGELVIDPPSGGTVIIEDAQDAVLLDEGSSVSLTNARFENNYTGVVHNGLGGSFSMPIFANTTFIGTEPLLPHWNGNPDPHGDSWANTGISVISQNLLKLSTGGANSKIIFDNLRIGIIMLNTNGIIQHTEFKNIRAIEGNAISGTGIACFGSGTALTVWGEGDLSSTLFDNCTNGIGARETRLVVRNVEMKGIGNDGINLVDGFNLSVSITDNIISAAGNGVSLDNLLATSTHVTDNEINTIPNVQGHPLPDEKNAILIANSNSARRETRIWDNAISIMDESIGINFKTVNLFNVRNNEITTATGAIEYTGISLEDSNFNTLKSNNVTGNFSGTAATLPFNSFGIKVVGSFNGFYSCNIVDATEAGVHFDDTNLGTKLQNTQFNHHFHGLDYTNLGQTGGQPSFNSSERAYGNRWLGSFTGLNGTIGAFHGSLTEGVLEQNEYAVKGNQDMQPEYPGDNLLDVHKDFWMLDDSDRPEILNLCNQSAPTPPDDDLGTEKTGTNDIDGKIVDGTFASDGYQGPMQWKAKRFLYEHLERDETLRPEGSVFESFYNAQSGTSVGSFTDAGIAMEAIIEIDPTFESQLENLYGQHTEVMDSVIVIDSLMEGATGNGYEQLAAERQSQITTLDNVTQSISSIRQTVETERDVLINAALAQNSAISATAVYEQNEKTVNDIYLNTFAYGQEPDNTQVATLEIVAIQCPYSGGNAVRRARSMLSGRTDLVFDNSACNGQQQLILPTDDPEQKEETYKIYPNPVKDQFTVSIISEDEVQREIQLLDIHGRLLEVKILKEWEQTTSFQTAKFVSGMYFVKVLETGKEVFSGKVIVQ